MNRPKVTKSLSFRLSLLIVLVVMAGMCAISGFFILQNFERTVNSERLRLADTSHAFAAASSAPLANNDLSEVFGVLRGISEVENAEFIIVRNMEGETVAEIGSSILLSGRDGLADDKGLWATINADNLTTLSPIWANGVQIGELEIHSDISWLRSEYADTVFVLAFAALSFAIIVAVIVNIVIKRSLRPLTKMSETLLAMGKSPDLSARFNINSDDEVGVLARSFNDAFDTIEERDDSIRRHTDELEETVRLRTHELQIAAFSAEQANASKSQFLATMSHEIRTPMNGMLMMAELLASSNLSPKQKRFAEVISRSGTSLLHIINDVLDMSKIEAGKLDLESVPFSLSTLVEDTISLYSATAEEKGLKLAMVISPRLSDEFIGDPTRLGQIISNLVSNALKFTHAGGVTIRIDAQEAQATTQALRISVIDTGVGVASDKLKTIFEAFSQADQTITRNFGGTGLGLTICRRLVAAMQGTIDVQSTVGEGTAFLVALTLPVHTAATQSIEAERAYNIAIIDDNPVSRSASEEMVSARGMNVISAGSAAEADLILASTESVNVDALVDNTVPVVLVADHGNGFAKSADGLNVVAIVTAPISNSTLADIIACLNVDDWRRMRVTNVAQASASLGDFSGRKVLAVDDNAVNCEVLNEALTALNVTAKFASSGEEAVEMAGREAFDLIFMDCSMPGMDGYEATKIIRNGGESSKAHIVALTAHVGAEMATRWQQAGMDSYMAKPFTIEDLRKALSAVSGSTDAAVQLPSDSVAISKDDEGVLPILSPETLEMFNAVGAQTGSDMKATVFNMFIDQVDDALAAVLDAAQADPQIDFVALKDLTHALKSMCGSAGAQAMHSACDAIENAAARNIAPAVEDLEGLQVLCAQTKAAMRAQVADKQTEIAQKRHVS